MTLIPARGGRMLGARPVTIGERLGVALDTSRLQPSIEAFETVGKLVVPFERLPDRVLQLLHRLLSTSMGFDEGGVGVEKPEHALSFVDS
jgi:hypothetical protein